VLWESVGPPKELAMLTPKKSPVHAVIRFPRGPRLPNHARARRAALAQGPTVASSSFRAWGVVGDRARTVHGFHPKIAMLTPRSFGLKKSPPKFKSLKI